ncbi:apolipoprotein L1 isoform X3 [Parambassis ranga]|uniref:Apolipoprotein L1 isoform X3 n=1 Tax=Parambassis ranga TaxID=210632 RepID=A0A6P7K3J0_9TELE|nr:uncharacterized protein LOC114450137 isoform X3 [Parambassis ranga]
MFKKTYISAKDEATDPPLPTSSDSLTDNKPSEDESGLLGGIMKRSPTPGHAWRPSQESGGMFSTKPSAAKTQSQEDLSEPGELSGSTGNLPVNSNTKKDIEDTDAPQKTDKQVEENLKPVRSNMIQQEKKEGSETPLVPPRQTEEEMKGTATHAAGRTEQNKKDAFPAETPVIPARPLEEEMNRGVKHGQKKQKNNQQILPEDEDVKEGESAAANDEDKIKPPESRADKVKKHKHANPFMPRPAPKAACADEVLKEDEEFSSKEEKKEEEKHNTDETKVKKPKKHNPFMPRVKAKVRQRQPEDEAAGNTAENEGAKRSLFDQLEDLRVAPAEPEDGQDVEDLMDWWNTVEQWEDTPQDEDMTEKEEAKAFAVTADKVQKGIRVFNKLFLERAESLWQHVINLNSIADALDKFNKNTKIAQITGGSTSAIGGVATIAGLALAPVTMGTSLIVTAVGLGIATAGGLTSAGAGISNQVNNSMDRKKVEKIVEDYQEKMGDLNKCLKFIKQGIENLRRFDLIKMKNHAYNQDFPVLSTSFYEDGAMAGKAILTNANEIMRVMQITNVAGSTAARAVQIASMATGVLTGLFVGMDIYFVAKDSKELKKGAKSEFAAKIREVSMQLHDGLVELNSIREELQSAMPQNNTYNSKEPVDSAKKDEIEHIKKSHQKGH